ncbi:ATP synthase subunit I [Motiliproteus sp. MSK22-1]|uniref:ATP synthase subunit I n=1 Tax=Motiliproteus sp. MSK22-1 TaxID=1897630 RepID=UPI000976E5C3|nr:ATP synthase subunit I [Motiliproteus sp. MSK22-1]OMH39638.1 hypothetical protein BGP75_02025 [Motiliproteus sp. MSK22-1]
MGKTGSRQFKGRTASKNRKLIQRTFVVQILLTFLIGVGLYLTNGLVDAYSAWLGGLIYLLPSLYQAKQVFTEDDSKSVRQILGNIYKSEIWKMALTMVLFGVVFSTVKPIEPFPIFGVFILMQMVAWLAPLFSTRGR